MISAARGKAAFFGTVLLVLGAVAGCSTASGPDGRESSVTVYGTVDAGVSVTRDR
jgi:predicted porin